MRSPFSPDYDEDLVRFDWSQIEFRLLVHKSIGPGSEEAVRMYNEDPSTDFHDMVVALTQLERDYAKNINFGFAFGMGVDLLCKILGTSREKGMEILNKYHTKVPFVKATSDAASRAAKNRGVITTILGRKARFPGGEFSHKALNRYTQGSSADIMKASMVEVWEGGLCNSLGAPLLTVHDELLWSAPRTYEAKEALLECRNIMENTVKLRVPTPTAMEIGSNWSNCKEENVIDYFKDM
jgi:DNA polymerase-1